MLREPPVPSSSRHTHLADILSCMIERILTELDNEISRLQQVRALLTPEGAKVASTPTPTAATAKRKHSKLSPAARKRIGDAQRARWAKQKAAK